MSTDTDTRWLTYDAMSEALGITPDSARRLAARNKHWPRKPGNDGRTLVGVPAERIPDTPPALPSDNTPDAVDDDGDDSREDVTLIVSVLTQHIERLEKDLETVKSERDAERLQAAQLALKAAQVDALQQVIEIERQRSEERQRQVEDVKAERDRWADQAEKLAAARSWWSKILLRA